jgi:hypothetical protein
MEFLFIGAITLFVLERRQRLSTGKFIKDNSSYLHVLMEDDYAFYARAKYGEDLDIQKLFDLRIRNGLITIVLFFFIFISELNFLNIVASLVAGYFVFKLGYFSVKNYYKKHLHEIDAMLPYFLKNLEILIQHYTVPVAIAKSIDDAPEIFRPGLRELIEKINSGDSSINPYMDFAKQYPVRDSMRMMRLLYRLGLGAQANKHEQLLVFARTVSNLQNKAREQKYKDRLTNMERRTLYMLVATGGGVMAILLLSMLLYFQY